MTEEEIVKLAEAILVRIDMPTKAEILQALYNAVADALYRGTHDEDDPD